MSNDCSKLQSSHSLQGRCQGCSAEDTLSAVQRIHWQWMHCLTAGEEAQACHWGRAVITYVYPVLCILSCVSYSSPCLWNPRPGCDWLSGCQPKYQDVTQTSEDPKRKGRALLFVSLYACDFLFYVCEKLDFHVRSPFPDNWFSFYLVSLVGSPIVDVHYCVLFLPSYRKSSDRKKESCIVVLGLGDCGVHVSFWSV